MRIVAALIALLLLIVQADAADRYWVGGSATWDATAGSKWATTSGGAGGAAVPTISDAVFMNAASGAVTVTVSGTRSSASLTFTGFTGTLEGTSTPQITVQGGNVLFVAGMTIGATPPTIRFDGTGNRNLTTAGKTIGGVTADMDADGSTLTLQDNLTSSGVVFFGRGVFEANNKNVTATQFRGTALGATTINMGSGTWTATTNGGGGSAADCFVVNTGDVIDKGTSTLVLSGTGSSGRTIDAKGNALNNLTVTGGTGTLTIQSTTIDGTISLSGFTGGLTLTSSTFNSALSLSGLTGIVAASGSGPVLSDVNFTGYTGTWRPDAFSIKGSLTLGTGMTVSGVGTGSLTFSATATGKTITSNGKSLAGGVASPVVFDGAGGGWTLQDALTAGDITLTNGGLDTNGQAVTAKFLSSSNTNTRSLTLGATLFTLTENEGWNVATSTNLTVSAASSTIKLTAGQPEFHGGSKTYGIVWFSNIGDTQTAVISGANTFGTLQDDPNEAHILQFAAGTTQTITTWDVIGDTGKLISLRSSSGGSQFTLSKSSGTVNADFLNIQDSVATGGATWNAGASSVNSGNNSGWNFAGGGSSIIPAFNLVHP